MKQWLIIFLILSSLKGFSLGLTSEYSNPEEITVINTGVKPGTNGRETWTYGMRGNNKMAYWSNLIVGSGSGAINVSAQGSLNPGDFILVVAGTYASGGSISNISGAPGLPITMMPQSGNFTVTFTGGMNFLNNKYMIVQYFENTTHSHGWNINGNGNNTGGLTGVSNVLFTHMHFSNISGAAFNNFNNVVFNYTTADTTTLACYKCNADSITLDNCGGFVRGSFGTVGNGIDVCLNDTFTRILFNDFASNGSGFIGIQLRHLAAYITVHQSTFRAYAADQGLFTYGGGGNGFSGTIHDVYINGPVSTWIARLNAYALFNSTTDSVLVYNVQATNKSTFGGVVIQSLSGDLIAGKVASCNAAVYNISTGNCPTLNTFWNYVVDIGSGMHSQTVHIKNCVGFNNAFSAKPPGVIIDESSGNPPTYDTSNNIYAVSATLLGMDSSGIWPTYAPLSNSILINKGVATPYTTGGQLDLSGNPWGAPPSKGPYMQSTTQINTTPLSFVTIASSPDLVITAGRGAEGWNNRIWDNGVGGGIRVPVGNVTRFDDYYRLLWAADLEPTTQGAYDFTKFDQQINQAIDSGRLFNWALMPMCSACGFTDHGISGLTYPSYLHTLMQGEATNSKDWQVPSGAAAGLWVPNWNSPNYIARYGAALRALANHISTGTHGGKNYRDVCFYVDIRGNGDFGEWHNYPYYPLTPTGRTATSASLKQIIDSNLLIFPNYPNVILQGAFDPGNASITPNDVSYYALTVKNAWGDVGWRRDNVGDKGDSVILDKNPGSYNPGTGVVQFAPLIMAKFKTAPIVGEPFLSSSTFDCGSIMCDAPREATLYGMTKVGDGNFANTGDAGTQANFIAMSRNLGYRLLLSGGSMTTTLAIGSSFNVTLNWQNVGASPTYLNWNVVYQLRNAGGTTVASWTSAFNPKLFLPALTSSSISDNFLMPSITTGTNYSLYVKVVDPIGYRPPLSLAITGRGVDGAYLVRGGITVNAGGPPFRVNAGLDQSLVSGVTTASVTGIVPPDSVNLIIIQGESNAAGNADNTPATTAELAARPNLQILDHNTGAYTAMHVGVNNEQGTFIGPAGKHGFELDLANLIDSGYFAGSPASPVYMVKIGISGSVICQWFPPNGCIKVGDTNPFDAWDGYMPFVDSAISKLNQLGKKYRIIVWGSLGLNDRYNQGTSPASFMTQMSSLIQNIKSRYNRNDIKFLYTDFNNPTAQTYDWSTYFTQMQTNIPNFFSIPVTGATYIDAGVHWDYFGMKLIDKNFITRMLNDPSLLTGIGGTYTQSWSKVSGPNNPTIVSPSSKTTSITGMVDGSYTFRFTVTDSVGTSISDDVNINIGSGTPVGPTAIATNSGPITLPTSTVSLTGSASTDDNGTITSYTWTNVSGPNTPTITTPSASNTTVTGLTQGAYVFRLTIVDNHAQISITTTAVQVNPQPATGLTTFTTQVPVSGTGGPDQAGGIEVGMKFRSSQTGFVTGVRFYKTAGNSGTHTGELYQYSNGARLGQVVFSGETATGWQTATFGSPIAILANTTYVVTYLGSGGFYTADNDLGSGTSFHTAIVNTPLTGLADQTDGPNGLFSYTSSPLLPTQFYHAGNYYVDVNFTQNLAPNPVIINPTPPDTLTLPVNFLTLDGSQSHDQDGTIVSYAWSQLPGGPSAANILTPNASSTGIVILVQGNYTFQLQVTDNLGSIGTINKNIVVLPAPPPTNQCNCHGRTTSGDTKVISH